MALTLGEGLKVIGNAVADLGEDMEKADEEGTEFNLTKEEIVNRVVSIMVSLGHEIAD